MLAVLLACALLEGGEAPPASAARTPLLGRDYPIEVETAFHAALLHWIDSLAGLSVPGCTAGKTVPVHRSQFHRFHGAPSELDRARLAAFQAARVGFARGAALERRDDLTLAFFAAPDLTVALERARPLLDPGAGEGLAQALEHFGARYRPVWNEGQVVADFLARSAASRHGEQVGRFLVELSRFFAVELSGLTPPKLVLVPVPDGAGTHAQAIGPYLLIEVRPGESLRDEIAPIVHENAHFLFYGIKAERRAALEAAAVASAPWGRQAFALLLEALPTALAQGEAQRRIGPDRFSTREPWYHLPAVDAYAKRIHPLVRQALAAGRVLDEALMRELVARGQALSYRKDIPTSQSPMILTSTRLSRRPSNSP